MDFIVPADASTFWLLLFWLSSLLVVYPYLVYPALLIVATHWRERRSEKPVREAVQSRVQDRDADDGSARSSDDSRASAGIGDRDWPAVTLIASAYNERPVIDAKIENALALDYPAERLSIVVVSDASDDGTDERVQYWQDRDARIRLVRQGERLGKTAGLNLAMRDIETPIVVFSDANALFERDALKQLVRGFDDSAVGYVVGAALYSEPDTDAGESEGLYWRYELWIKALESRFHSVVGGDGAIYAIRRELFWPLAPSDINDFVNPLQIVAAGHRGRFVPEARCHEQASDEFAKEFRRKRRIVNRSWRAVLRYLPSFHWRRDAAFLFMLVSHKCIRWFSGLFLLLALVSSLVLSVTVNGTIYPLAATTLLLTLALAVLGQRLDAHERTMPGLVYIPYYFHAVALASLFGVWDQLRGVEHVTWGHVRT